MAPQPCSEPGSRVIVALLLGVGEVLLESQMAEVLERLANPGGQNEEQARGEPAPGSRSVSHPVVG